MSSKIQCSLACILNSMLVVIKCIWRVSEVSMWGISTLGVEPKTILSLQL
jgi:hypothetical protein